MGIGKEKEVGGHDNLSNLHQCGFFAEGENSRKTEMKGESDQAEVLRLQDCYNYAGTGGNDNGKQKVDVEAKLSL